MGHVEKQIRKWLRSPPRYVPKEKVMAVLDRYFKGLYEKKSGSHIVVRDERLQGLEGFGLLGEFSIAVKGGQRVKGFYLRRLAIAVSIISDLEID